MPLTKITAIIGSERAYVMRVRALSPPIAKGRYTKKYISLLYCCLLPSDPNKK